MRVKWWLAKPSEVWTFGHEIGILIQEIGIEGFVWSRGL